MFHMQTTWFLASQTQPFDGTNYLNVGGHPVVPRDLQSPIDINLVQATSPWQARSILAKFDVLARYDWAIDKEHRLGVLELDETPDKFTNFSRRLIDVSFTATGDGSSDHVRIYRSYVGADGKVSSTAIRTYQASPEGRLRALAFMTPVVISVR